MWRSVWFISSHRSAIIKGWVVTIPTLWKTNTRSVIIIHGKNKKAGNIPNLAQHSHVIVTLQCKVECKLLNICNLAIHCTNLAILLSTNLTFTSGNIVILGFWKYIHITLHCCLSRLVGSCANIESETVSVYILECNTDHQADKKKKKNSVAL